MTVSYTLDVSTTNFMSFTRLLLRWRGSVWKAIYQELLVWLLLYFVLSAIYRFVLNDEQRKIFEDTTYYCYKSTELIPVTFILGFFVNLVVRRWWEMLKNIGWVDNTSLYIATYVEGTDDKARMIRRNIVRYMVLVQAMVLRDISVPIRRRFPTLETLQVAGFMSTEEMKKLNGIPTRHARYWIPMQWAMMLVKRARREGSITTDFAVHDLLTRLREYRTALGTLLCYDWVPVPLVYVQVVTLAVRCYFLICLMGRQFVKDTNHDAVNSSIDIYIPLLTIIQFVFYYGWLKVAEALLNPLGEDDDDFEINYLLDRNLQAALTIVDYTEDRQPTLEKDIFWSEPFPEPLYSAETINSSNSNPYAGSATEMQFNLSKESDVIMMPRIHKESMNVAGKEKPARKPIVVRSLTTVSRTRRDPASFIRPMKRGMSLINNRVNGPLQRQKSINIMTIENGELPLSPKSTSNSLSSCDPVLKDLAPMTTSTINGEKVPVENLPTSPTHGCEETETDGSLGLSVPQLLRLYRHKKQIPRPSSKNLSNIAEEDNITIERHRNIDVNKLS